jgi:formate hydrogenlyase subunit 3/multisubunit Na+/H+ antiporter MnhD subunit
MSFSPHPGKILIVIGLGLAAVGVLLLLADKIPFLGRLPGDIVVKKDNFSFYFPLTTCLIVSIVLSLLLYLFRK